MEAVHLSLALEPHAPLKENACSPSLSQQYFMLQSLMSQSFVINLSQSGRSHFSERVNPRVLSLLFPQALSTLSAGQAQTRYLHFLFPEMKHFLLEASTHEFFLYTLTFSWHNLASRVGELGVAPLSPRQVYLRISTVDGIL